MEFSNISSKIVLILVFLFSFLHQGDIFAMKISSSAFQHQSFIPSKYTCQGNSISPDLLWRDIPAGTKSLVLIMEDPDAPMGLWTHWILYNIPPEITSLAENVKVLPKGTEQGLNTLNETGYVAPCPPSGTHRYYFRLYALDTVLQPNNKFTNETLKKAMEKHILAQTELMGNYAKKPNS
jgi:hypothetical protein